jgi:chromosome segregation ATPase
MCHNQHDALTAAEARAEQAERSAADKLEMMERWQKLRDDAILKLRAKETELDAVWAERNELAEYAGKANRRAEQAERDRDTARQDLDDTTADLAMMDERYATLMAECDQLAASAAVLAEALRSRIENECWRCDLLCAPGVTCPARFDDELLATLPAAVTARIEQHNKMREAMGACLDAMWATRPATPEADSELISKVWGILEKAGLGCRLGGKIAQ